MSKHKFLLLILQRLHSTDRAKIIKRKTSKDRESPRGNNRYKILGTEKKLKWQLNEQIWEKRKVSWPWGKLLNSASAKEDQVFLKVVAHFGLSTEKLVEIIYKTQIGEELRWRTSKGRLGFPPPSNTAVWSQITGNSQEIDLWSSKRILVGERQPDSYKVWGNELGERKWWCCRGEGTLPVERQKREKKREVEKVGHRDHTRGKPLWTTVWSRKYWVLQGFFLFVCLQRAFGAQILRF